MLMRVFETVAEAQHRNAVIEECSAQACNLASEDSTTVDRRYKPSRRVSAYGCYFVPSSVVDSGGWAYRYCGDWRVFRCAQADAREDGLALCTQKKRNLTEGSICRMKHTLCARIAKGKL